VLEIIYHQICIDLIFLLFLVFDTSAFLIEQEVLKYNNHKQLLDRIFKLHPEISSINEIVPAKFLKSNKSIPKIRSLKSSFLVKNYYQSCPITRASINMANCIKRFSKKEESTVNG